MFFNHFSYKYMFRYSNEKDFEIESNMVIYTVAMPQISSRWDPVEACRPIIGETPVFYPTFEVPLDYHYHVL